jgi:hypothetical protein
MTTLPGNLQKEFQEALISAFPRYADLEQMVRHHLDENLESVAGPGPLDSVVFQLIKWAESRGQLDDLIQGAKVANPGNHKLKIFIDLYYKENGTQANVSVDTQADYVLTKLNISKDRKLRVFLCHASEDKPSVRKLYQKLLAEAWIDPWLDEEKLLPGQDWDREIEIALEDSDAVIVFISANSVSKEGYVQREVKRALDMAEEKLEGSIYIIPLRLDDSSLPRTLKKWQFIDFFPTRSVQVAYNRLLQSLKLRYEKI